MAIQELKIPNIGDFTDVPIVEVAVKEGDTVSKEDTLVSLESDKAVMEVPSEFSGVIKSISVKEGDTVSEGDVIGTIEVESQPTEKNQEQQQKDKEKTKEKNPEKKTEERKSAEEEKKEQPKSPQIQTAESASGKSHASPAVRKYAREHGADLSKITGTGPKGRIRKEDVTGYIKSIMSSGGAAVSTITVDINEFKKYGDIEITSPGRIKTISAPRLQKSWQNIPHVTHFEETDITDLEDFRKVTNSRFEDDGIKLTVLAFAVKAAVIALKRYPLFNSSYIESEGKFAVKKYYNIGFAADTPDGLLVPVIKNADKKGLVDVGKELIELSKKARDGKIALDDLKGSTFTISSLGSIGGTYFTPIINAPEVAILGLSKAFYKPVWKKSREEFVPRYVLPFSLSYDHRVIDGAEGARFCSYMAEVLSDVRNLLL